MTRRRSESNRIPRAWIIPLLFLVAILTLASTGVVSRSIIADLVAWLPAWLLGLIAAWAFRGSRMGRVRLAAIVPLVTAIVMGLLVYGHLQGWPIMPSSQVELVGPIVTEEETASFSASLDGDLNLVASTGEFLYRVTPIRTGGAVGIPNAREQHQGTDISVALSPRTDPGLYTFAGWNILLAPQPAWALTLRGDIDADLTGLTVSSVQVSGAGRLRFGRAAVETPISVDGSFEIEVPAGTAVAVVGPAEVPIGWSETESGYQSTAEGVGWLIAVSPDSDLTITEE